MIDISPVNTKLFVVIIFLVCYLLLILKKGNPLIVVGAGIIILCASSCMNLRQMADSINYNVLGVFWGTMVLSELFIFSGVPAYLAIRLVERAKTVGGALLAVCALAGFISSFVENVATVLIVAPIAFEVSRKLKANPVPFLIGIAVSSNLQGCATMIGDSPSIILAMSANMTFNDFFWISGRPGVFFAVELAAIGSFFVLYLIFRKYRSPVEKIGAANVKTWFPTVLLILMLATLAGSSLLEKKPPYIIALICVSYGLIGLVWHEIRHKESLSVVRDLDWRTFFFLIGIFILVGSLTSAGVVKDIAAGIAGVARENGLAAYLIIVWLSVLLSAFIDNIPYTVAMIPVAKLIAQDLGMSMYPMLFGLLLGTCIGGNITPIGASANVVAMGLLKKEGHHPSFLDFTKIGLPFTITAVLISSAFVWFVWAK